jgi:hypothetical protein
MDRSEWWLAITMFLVAVDVLATQGTATGNVGHVLGVFVAIGVVLGLPLYLLVRGFKQLMSTPPAS